MLRLIKALDFEGLRLLLRYMWLDVRHEWSTRPSDRKWRGITGKVSWVIVRRYDSAQKRHGYTLRWVHGDRLDIVTRHEDWSNHAKRNIWGWLAAALVVPHFVLLTNDEEPWRVLRAVDRQEAFRALLDAGADPALVRLILFRKDAG